MWTFVKNILESPNASEELFKILRVLVWIVVGLPLLMALSRWVGRVFTRNLSAQHGLIAAKSIFLAGIGLIVVSVFNQLGFSIGPLLGTAGVLGVAIGFASQTSLSNLISGLFLMAERHFVVGDIVTIGELTGEILTVDLLSVKIRTFDNKHVRLPNETIIKSQVTNVTHFPIRRVDLNLGVAYKEDIAHVRSILTDLARRNPLCLMEPEPTIILNGFGASSVDILFLVWAAREDWLAVKNSMMEEIKERFDKEGIEFPFPHVSIYAGSATGPIPVRVVQEESSLKTQ